MNCTRIIKFLFGALFFATPLIFNSMNSELFELPKMYFVYFISTLILSLHLINVINYRQILFKRSFLDIPLLIFITSQIISTIFSIDPHTSIFGYYSRLNGGLLSLFSYALLYWILIVYLDNKLKKEILIFSLISGIIVATYGILEHFGIDKHIWVQDVQNRVFSTLGQPNWLAAYLCILIALFFNSPFAILFFFCLIFTRSKTGIFASIIILPFLFGKSRIRLVNSLLLISLVTFFFLNKKPSLPTSPTLNITASENIRKIVWQGAIDLYKRYPLIGTGVESFAYSYYWTRPASHNLTSEWEYLYNKAHNEYINYLATTGTFGFVSYSIIIISCLFHFFKKKQFIYLAAYLSILITNFSGFSVVVTSLYFYLLPALISDEK